MSKTSRFKPDLHGIGKMMTRADMHAAMDVYIQIVKRAAEALSPVGEDTPPGAKHYIECFETYNFTQLGRPKGGHENRRAAAGLDNTSDHALAVEFGANGVRKDRVLRNALDTLGPADGPVVKERWDF